MVDESSYGYIRRLDNPDRMVPVPPQATPDDQLPNAVADAVRNPPKAVAEHFQIFYARQINNEKLVTQSSVEADASGGGGAATDTYDTWYSRIARFCHVKSHHHTSGGMGFSEHRISLDQSIWALLATDAPGGPFILRAEDIIAAELAYTSSGSMASHFGFRSNVAVINTLTPNGAFVGFYCAVLDSAAYPVWHCGVWSDGGSAVDDHTTAITCEHPHHLRVDVDAQAGEARFYIDGTLVHTSSSVSGTFSQVNDDGSLSWILCCGGTGSHTADAKMGMFMEKAHLSLRVLDEAA